MTSKLQDLQNWFASNCDGEWEHGDGITIQTLDNPGWRMSIDLEGTALEDVPFAELKRNYEHETEWMRCWKEGFRFEAVGGLKQLDEMLSVFLEWAKKVG
jgi:hypothetical protein